ncbi:MAG: hypothetical protein QNJ36_01675 [Calothrix sp. MO_167.B42]|nr:hypothetical protein [Calothrix sp. MO_167.B42]
MAAFKPRYKIDGLTPRFELGLDIVILLYVLGINCHETRNAVIALGAKSE